ncbi:DUF4013 domain-containing protein [bacterium]|nr:DUF4013 domain-containing protein [bacterium]
MGSDRRFVGRAWRDLAGTRSLFGKLCLLTLLQVVPVIGQMALLGCAMSWLREAAWGMRTPLPKHVLGAQTPGFWSRGAKAWVVIVLYAMIGTAATTLLAGSLSLAGYELSGMTMHVVSALLVAAIVVVWILLAILLAMGLVRLAIYDRFSTAWQWGQQMRMAGADFGGLVKIFFGLLLQSLLVGVFVCVAAVLAVAGTASLGVHLAMTEILDGALQTGSAAPVMSAATAFGAWAIVLCVVAFVLSVPSTILDLVGWRALGTWAALLDVPAWGAPGDPLPAPRASLDAAAAQDVAEAPRPATPEPAPAGEAGEATTAPAATQATPAADAAPDASGAASREPERHGHPVTIIVVCCLVCALAGAGATAFGIHGMVGKDGDGAERLGQALSVPGLTGDDWVLANGQVVEFNDDGTFTWHYDGVDGSQWVSGTYEQNRRSVTTRDLMPVLATYGVYLSRGDVASVISSGLVSADVYEVRLHVERSSGGAGDVDGRTFDATFLSCAPLSVIPSHVTDDASGEVCVATRATA